MAGLSKVPVVSNQGAYAMSRVPTMYGLSKVSEVAAVSVIADTSKLKTM